MINYSFQSFSEAGQASGNRVCSWSNGKKQNFLTWLATRWLKAIHFSLQYPLASSLQFLDTSWFIRQISLSCSSGKKIPNYPGSILWLSYIDHPQFCRINANDLLIGNGKTPALVVSPELWPHPSPLFILRPIHKNKGEKNLTAKPKWEANTFQIFLSWKKKFQKWQNNNKYLKLNIWNFNL